MCLPHPNSGTITSQACRINYIMTRFLESKYNSAIINVCVWKSALGFATMKTLCVKTRIHPSHSHRILYVLCLYNIIMNKQDALDVLFCISLTQQLSVFYQEALSEYANYHHEFIMHTRRSRFHHIYQLDQPAYIGTRTYIVYAETMQACYDVCTNYYLRRALQSICLHTLRIYTCTYYMLYSSEYSAIFYPGHG